MSISLRERWLRVWQPVSDFLLMLESGGLAGGLEDVHERLKRLEATQGIRNAPNCSSISPPDAPSQLVPSTDP